MVCRAKTLQTIFYLLQNTALNGHPAQTVLGGRPRPADGMHPLGGNPGTLLEELVDKGCADLGVEVPA